MTSFPAPSPPKHILSLGAAVLDTIFRVEEIPATPTKVLPTECVQIGSGMASSAAAAVAKLGGYARIWGRVGGDPAGKQYLDDLTKAGVDTAQVRRIEGGRTAMSTILVDRWGAALVVPFYDPSLDQSPDWLPLNEIPGFDFVLADTRWPDGAAALLNAARECHVPSLFDADIAPPDVLRRLAPLADYVVFSAAGLRIFTDTDDLSAGLRAATKRGHGLMGVTAAERGFYWFDGVRVGHAPAPSIGKVIDTLAAGDVFHGAFALMLAEGHGVADAGRFASAAASIKCTRFGGRLGAPKREEVEALLGR